MINRDLFLEILDLARAGVEDAVYDSAKANEYHKYINKIEVIVAEEDSIELFDELTLKRGIA